MNIKVARINGLEVSVCGVGDLPDFATHGVTHIVSIWDGYKAGSQEPGFLIDTIFPNAQKHFVYFNDVFNQFTGEYSPGHDAIRDILHFTGGLNDGHYLLVHCRAGVSRSTAVAFATLCQRAGPGLEFECLQALKQIRPSASPNPLIVQIADELLERNGVMIEAVNDCRSVG